ncbi:MULTISPECIES: NADPH-dependent FMN reductase [unclassified Bacillus (in: firmicutes)]|uniref:NADPH-dependent FMN reductase n=1 Tax=unclassified Bacillus (in: firmicutes) TaxID=185979 RepID=UPI0008E327F5|nr:MULTISPECIES: NADPH-dependent FMN reductase [unclassified Bacillus (in: firmicutes)]SFH96345.1 NAD(P)H-dependent FMN reductase [Bacillus sp. 71mf]SFS94739.1 NAD(P)H-dependent FMN reductase [Bacillus sp. 103mf]
MPKTIGLICGSLRENSYNRIIAQSLTDMSNAAQFRWIEINDLPLFNEDLEIGGALETITSFKSAIQGVDGIIIVSPEYNSGIPGALKNALDWASRPRESSVLSGKPVGLIGSTPGGLGTVFAQMQIRQILEAMQAHVLPFQKVLISQVHEKIDSDQKVLTDEKTKQYLQRYLQQFIHWIDHTPVLD